MNAKPKCEPLWTGDHDRRLRALILGMWPYPKVFAEFPDFTTSTVRDAWRRLFIDAPTPTEQALFVLVDRATVSRGSPTGLRLDGRPASAVQLVDAANIVLKADGRRLIAYLGAAQG